MTTNENDWEKRCNLFRNLKSLDTNLKLKNVPISVVPVLCIHLKDIEKDYKDKIKILKYNDAILHEVKSPQVPKSNEALELINKYGGLAYNFARNQYRRSEIEIKEAKLKYKHAKSLYDNYIEYCSNFMTIIILN